MDKINNVIPFPSKGNHVPKKLLNDEDVSFNISMVKHNHINETLNTIIPILFANIEIAGFSLDNDEEDDECYNIKNGALIVESIRALLCKYHDIEHPFLKLAENIFEDNEDGSMKVVKKLNLEFTPIEEGSES